MFRRTLQAALVALLAAAAVDFTGFKLGAWRPTPALLAALMGASALLAVVEAGLVVRELWRGPRGVARAGKLAALLGLLLMAGGGLVNWMSSVRGYTVLLEGEKVPLAGGRNVRGLEVGLLAATGELDATLGLLSVDLQDAPGGFYPEAVVLATRPGRERERLVVLQDVPAALGSLRLFLGAFGFAPRIVVLKGDETLLDDTVLFTTRRDGEAGVAFEGETEVGDTGLRVLGAVVLKSDTAVVKGHPSLQISLRRGEEEIGGGDVQLGHFASAKDGYRVGIAGMKKWAELDISRPNRPVAALAGTVLCAVGLLAWALGAWRRR